MRVYSKIGYDANNENTEKPMQTMVEYTTLRNTARLFQTRFNNVFYQQKKRKIST